MTWKRSANRRKYGESSNNNNNINVPQSLWRTMVSIAFAMLLLLAFGCFVLHYGLGMSQNMFQHPLEGISALLMVLWVLWHYSPHALRYAARICEAMGLCVAAAALIRIANAIEAW